MLASGPLGGILRPKTQNRTPNTFFSPITQNRTPNTFFSPITQNRTTNTLVPFACFILPFAVNCNIFVHIGHISLFYWYTQLASLCYSRSRIFIDLPASRDPIELSFGRLIEEYSQVGVHRRGAAQGSSERR